MFSCFSEYPGPLVAVMTLAPVTAAPRIAPIAAISSSIWMKRPPTCGSRTDRCSAISEDGEMGYPPKKRQPARIAAWAQASLPCSSFTFVGAVTGFTSSSWRVGSSLLGAGVLARDGDREVGAQLLAAQAF